MSSKTWPLPGIVSLGLSICLDDWIMHRIDIVENLSTTHADAEKHTLDEMRHNFDSPCWQKTYEGDSWHSCDFSDVIRVASEFAGYWTWMKEGRLIDWYQSDSQRIQERRLVVKASFLSSLSHVATIFNDSFSTNYHRKSVDQDFHEDPGKDSSTRSDFFEQIQSKSEPFLSIEGADEHEERWFTVNDDLFG